MQTIIIEHNFSMKIYKFKITSSVVENSCNKLATDNTTTNGFTTAATGSGTIKGKVINDSNNSGLSGVIVQFYGTTIDNTTTDSNGEFSEEVDVGDYTISYSKDGYLDESQDVPLETDNQTLVVPSVRLLPTSGANACASTGIGHGDAQHRYPFHGRHHGQRRELQHTRPRI